MKITFVLPGPSMGGGTRVVAIYADLLQRRGHKVTIVAPPNRRPTIKDALRYLVENGKLPPKPIATSHLDYYNLDVRLLNQYRPVTDTDVPDGDVVIATWWETAEWVYKLNKSKGKKIHFIQAHEVFNHQPISRVHDVYRMDIEKITISKILHDNTFTNYGKTSKIIYNSVDRSLFYAEERSKNTTPSLGFLYSSAIQKNMTGVFYILSKIQVLFPNVRIHALGAESLKKQYLSVRNLTYHYLPEQRSIKDIYSSCDVWICASSSEGFHLPPLEAMACRTPVVSTRVGGPDDFIIQGKNGYIVEVDDMESLVDRTTDVLNFDNSRWKEMSQNAYSTSIGYTWDDAGDALEQYLKDIA